MTSIRFLSAAQVRGLLEPIELRSALEAALIAQSQGHADVPPRIAAAAPLGLLAAMPGFLQSGEQGVLATKLVAIFPDNVDVPSHQGVIVYFDASTGTPMAVMDAEVVTEDRTAMTAAIAADRLASAEASVLTIVGAGAQGRAHLRAFAELRPWAEIRVVSRDQARARALVDDGSRLGTDVAISAPTELDAAVRTADVVTLCTHAGEAVIDADWVTAGAHLSSVGSQAELPRVLVGVGPLVVDHLGAVTTPPPAGAVELQGVDPGSVIELGALLAGAPGRTSRDEITVYKSTGHAVQDLAAAELVHNRAVARAIGTIVEL